jgi:hypothetical protein
VAKTAALTPRPYAGAGSSTYGEFEESSLGKFGIATASDIMIQNIANTLGSRKRGSVKPSRR